MTVKPNDDDWKRARAFGARHGFGTVGEHMTALMLATHRTDVLTVKAELLPAMLEAMYAERRNWQVRTSDRSDDFIATQAGRYKFYDYPFKTFREAESFVDQKMLAVGLGVLGIKVKGLEEQNDELKTSEAKHQGSKASG